MKTTYLCKNVLLVVAASAVLMTTGCGKQVEQPVAEVELITLEQKVTYIVGYRMAKQALEGEFSLDKAVMSMAIQDVANNKAPRFTQEEQQKVMMALQVQQEDKRNIEAEKQSKENFERSEAYLAAVAEKEGINITESGLLYKVITSVSDDAESPRAEDTVKVHYHGTMIDGTVFDSSIDRGEPVTFPVSGVIQGWVEGLQLMKLGETFEFYIPAELAYGENATGPIGPNSALIFKVELLEINPEVPNAEYEN